MRTVLESPYTGRLQLKRAAIAITVNAVALSSNPNGSLLLTWLLETSNLPGRYKLLVPRVTPHLLLLCTHKLATMTILRIVNQKADVQSSQIIVNDIFDERTRLLEDILSDQLHGVAFISKILASPFVDSSTRPRCCARIRAALTLLQVDQAPGCALSCGYSECCTLDT